MNRTSSGFESFESARSASKAQYTQGGDDALGQFNTPWQDGQYYVVHVEAGADGLNRAISTRVGPMEFGWNYYLCPGGERGSVCESPPRQLDSDDGAV